MLGFPEKNSSIWKQKIPIPKIWHFIIFWTLKFCLWDKHLVSSRDDVSFNYGQSNAIIFVKMSEQFEKTGSVKDPKKSGWSENVSLHWNRCYCSTKCRQRTFKIDISYIFTKSYQHKIKITAKQLVVRTWCWDSTTKLS